MEILVSNKHNGEKRFPIHEEIDFLRMILEEVRNWPFNFFEWWEKRKKQLLGTLAYKV